MPEATKLLFQKLVASPPDFQKHFILIGGTGLACHLQHRYSEDLDFFSWKSNNKGTYNQGAIIGFFRNTFDVSRVDILSENHLDMIVDNVKVSYVQNDVQEKPIKSTKITDSISIGTLEGIAICKLEAILSRKVYRDYFDLVEISKNFNLHELAKKAATYNGKVNDMAYLRAMVGASEKIAYENIRKLSGDVSPTPAELQGIITKKLRQEIIEMNP